MKTLFKSVALITTFSIITRALGLLLKIYISREISAEALGTYQIAISAFGLFLVFLSSGLPLIISKKTSSSPKSTGSVVYAGFLISTFACLLICIFVAFFPNIFDTIFGQKESTITLMFLLPAVVGTAIYVAFRGAFWGQKDFFTLGLIEFIEQVIRIVICLILFNISLPISGQNIVALSLSVACICSSIVGIIIYYKKGNRIDRKLTSFKPLIKESLPITFVRTISNVVAFGVSLIVPLFLIRSGTPKNVAISEFGIATGMVMPLITIAGTIIGSISTALIPEISNINNNRSDYQIKSAISASMLICTIITPIFIAFGNEIGLFLYNSKEAGKMLVYSSAMIIPLGLSQITTSVLNGTGKEKVSMIIYLLSSIFLFASIILLPKYIGIYSLIVGLNLSAIFTLIINLIYIRKSLNKELFKTILLSLLSMIIPTIIGRLTYNIISIYFTLFFSLLFSIIITLLTLIMMLMVLGLIKRENLNLRHKFLKT